MYSDVGNISPRNTIVKLCSFVKKRASKNVDVYIGISDFIKNFHQDNGFFLNAKSKYIYNSVEKIEFKKTTSSIIRVGFIGRLTKDKGFDAFCHYIANLKAINPGMQGVAAGRFNSGDEQDELKKLAADNGITLLGFVNLSAFLSCVDVVVLPVQWREPFGRVVVECVFADKIVLTNDVGGIAELAVMLPNVYLLKGSALDLSALTHEPVKMATVELFSRPAIAKSYLNVYDD